MFSGHLVEHIPQPRRVKQSVAVCFIAVGENIKKCAYLRDNEHFLDVIWSFWSLKVACDDGFVPWTSF